LTTFSY